MQSNSAKYIVAFGFLAFALTLPFAAGQAAPRAAVYDFTLIDTSAEGELLGKREDETRRLMLMTQTLRAALAQKGVYEIVDVAPAAGLIAKSQDFHVCGTCASDIAVTLGADVSVFGYVQKVSNLILNVNVEIRDAKTGKVVKIVSADIRSNTDESWLKGLNWLIQHRLSKPD